MKFIKDNFIISKKKNNFRIIIIILLGLVIINNKIYYRILFRNSINNYNIYDQIKLDYKNNKFVIIRDYCKTCGLFAFYKHYLACLLTFINKGYIPIIDLISFPNNFNGFNTSSLNKNPWELFFHQPYEYTLENVKKNAKHIKYSKCQYSFGILNNYIYLNNIMLDFWHNIALKYIPIKYKIIKESNIIIRKLFKGSSNVLGILARGTDYISFKPKSHPRQPKIKDMIKDIKKMDKKNKYDFFFLATEDDLIRMKLKKELGKKIKYLIKTNNIEYNYKEKKLLCFNKYIKGNLDFIRIYLINIIILSKCIDIIAARTSGTIGAFILSKGFRYTKLYFLGNYWK